MVSTRFCSSVIFIRALYISSFACTRSFCTSHTFRYVRLTSVRSDGGLLGFFARIAFFLYFSRKSTQTSGVMSDLLHQHTNQVIQLLKSSPRGAHLVAYLVAVLLEAHTNWFL